MVDATLARPRMSALVALLGGLLITTGIVYLYSAERIFGLGIGLLLASVGMWIAVTHRRLIYALLIVAIPLEATFVLEAGFSITPYYMLFGLLMFSYVVHSQKIRFDSTPAKLFAAYILVCAISIAGGLFVDIAALNGSNGMALRASALRPLIQLGLIAFHVLFFVVVLDSNRSKEDILRSVKVYLWVGLVLGVMACWQTLAVMADLPGKDFTLAFGSPEDSYYKYGQTRFYAAFITNFAPRATFRESLHFSHFIVSFLPLAMALILYRREIPKSWQIHVPRVLAVLAFVALFLTMSRSGWVAFAAAIGFMFLFLSKGRVLKTVAVTASLMLLIGVSLRWLGYFRFDLDLWNLMQLRMDLGMMEADPRVVYLQNLWSTFKQYPLLGVGIGNYGMIGAAKIGIDVVLSAHSVFLSALVETGIIGFLLLSGIVIHFLVVSIATIRRCRGLAPYPLLVGITAGVIGMVIQYCSFGDRPGFHFLFMMAIGYALVRYIKEIRFAATAQFN